MRAAEASAAAPPYRRLPAPRREGDRDRGRRRRHAAHRLRPHGLRPGRDQARVRAAAGLMGQTLDRLVHFVRGRIAVKLTLTLVGFVAIASLAGGVYLSQALDRFAVESL